MKPEILLQESEDKFRILTETAVDSIIIANYEGNIIFWNKSAEEVFGYSKNEALGKKLEIIIPEKYSVSHKEGLKRFIDSGKSELIGRTLEVIAKRKNNSEFPIELSLSAWRTHSKVFFCGIIRDISERKLAEKRIEEHTRKLLETRTQLLQSQKLASLGSLTSGLAHELNNPLNFVHGGVSALKNHLEEVLNLLNVYLELDIEPESKSLKDKIKKMKSDMDYNFVIDNILQLIDSIDTGALRTAKIVKSFRRFAIIDPSEKVLSNLHQGIENTLELFNSKFKNRVTLKKYFDNSIQSFNMYPGEMNQVFMSIIDNADKSIENNGVITISTMKKDGQILIKIKDNGVGIEENIQERIFDPFFTTREVGKGAGLGLSMAYGIIKKQEGEITINSTIGKGTEVIISIPYKPSND